MKRYRTPFNLLRRPGVLHLLFAGLVIVPLLLGTFLNGDYEDLVNRRRLAEKQTRLDIQFASEPPAFAWLRSRLAPTFAKTDTAAAGDVFELEDEATRPHWLHWLGTDSSGRDMLLNILQGAKVALGGSLLALAVALLLGVPMGVLSGYYGGSLRRLADFLAVNLTTLPRLIVLIIIVATLGYDFKVIMIAIGVLAAPKMMEIVHTRIQMLGNTQFIEAAREMGIPDWQIIFKHILWFNCKSQLLIQLTYEVAEVILLETTLSYLNLGVKDQLSWGSMLIDGMSFLSNQYFWMLFFPTLAIVLSITAFISLAEGLGKWLGREEVNP